MDEDELSPAEASRGKRRDRDADASRRAGMRTGLAKQFKQVLDIQRRRADEVELREAETAAESEARGRTRGQGRSPRRKP